MNMTTTQQRIAFPCDPLHPLEDHEKVFYGVSQMFPKSLSAKELVLKYLSGLYDAFVDMRGVWAIRSPNNKGVTVRCLDTAILDVKTMISLVTDVDDPTELDHLWQHFISQKINPGTIHTCFRTPKGVFGVPQKQRQTETIRNALIREFQFYLNELYSQ